MTDRFKFGENWQSFLEHLDEDRIERAAADLRDVYDVDSLEGRTFLDAGCGSGIFSLAAYRLGAERIVSFDYDPIAVECCERVRERTDSTGDEWQVTRGNLLDRDFVTSFGSFDYVYCWGVVHHTGSMWEAISNVTQPVSAGGKLCLGVYNEVTSDESFYDSSRALQIKRVYHSLPELLRPIMVRGYGLTHLTGRTVLKREDPFEYLRSYREDRGMEYWHDIEDWLGGLPFEFASPEQISEYFDQNHPGFEHIRTDRPADLPTAVNVYVFRQCD